MKSNLHSLLYKLETMLWYPEKFRRKVEYMVVKMVLLGIRLDPMIYGPKLEHYKLLPIMHLYL